MDAHDPHPQAPAPRTVLVLGPTAGGKSALAAELSRRMPGGGECVSADSMQVYVGMDIGTAKPTGEERRGVPHHMIDVADPHGGAFTLADWLDGAHAAIDAIHARGRHAVVVGGTNLYVKSLMDGMFDGPPPDPALRARLEAQPTEALRRELERHDPIAAARIHPNDRRRTVRALEVWTATGQPISALQRQWEDAPRTLPHGWHVVGLEWPVELINQRINVRVRAMVEAGLEAEVMRLLAKGPLNRQAVEAVGYREVLRHFAHGCSMDQAEEDIKARTRRYARQQRTWLRRFKAIQGAIWVDAPRVSTEDAASGVIRTLFGD
ncbi:MAG: tRNA (adenosine(37)-N6)-dimethylallyltransferase MiaA [Phycisphaerales bacterium]